MKQENIKAVVTGGAGFIGSHIADELVQRGWQVIILDNLSTGKKENVQHLVSAMQAELVVGSILDLPLLQNLFQGVDYVFHQAAIASVPRSVENPAASNETNVTGTLNVLMAARYNKVKKVVFASSCAVYGDDPTLPKKESMSPDLHSPYALTKLAGEYYCEIFYRIYGLATASLRYFNVYGPRQNPASEYAAVIPKFLQRIAEGEKLQIYGDGEQSRDFVYIKDIVSANLLFAENHTTGIFNIGSGKKITMNKLVEIMRLLLGREDIQPLYTAKRPGDIKHSLADITRAHAFGYNPQFTIEKGLTETIASLRTSIKFASPLTGEDKGEGVSSTSLRISAPSLMMGESLPSDLT